MSKAQRMPELVDHRVFVVHVAKALRVSVNIIGRPLEVAHAAGRPRGKRAIVRAVGVADLQKLTSRV